MKHPERIEDYLEHIADAIERATGYIRELDTVAALEHRKTQDAVIRSIEIIGEAATKMQQQAPEFVKAHPKIPWLQIRNMRNKMIHDYFDIELPWSGAPYNTTCPS